MPRIQVDCTLKGQSRFPTSSFFIIRTYTWATDQQVKLFSILSKISMIYSNFKFQNTWLTEGFFYPGVCDTPVNHIFKHNIWITQQIPTKIVIILTRWAWPGGFMRRRKTGGQKLIGLFL